MQINQESREKHTIRSYSDRKIIINDDSYVNSLIISRSSIISNWDLHSLADLSENHLSQFLEFKPEIIIFGHNQLNIQIPFNILQLLSQQRIGCESMSIGAASRTFNVLLGEQREVVAGIIFPAT